MLEAQQEKDKLNYNIAKLSTETGRLAFDKFQAAVNADIYLKNLKDMRKEEDPRPGSDRWRWYDEAMNNHIKALAKQAGYEGPISDIVSPPEIPKKKEEKKEEIVN